MSVSEFPIRPARQPREGRALHKGQQTKAAIIDAALGLATQIGLEGLSIGALAEVAQMSKSGVFAHFGSFRNWRIHWPAGWRLMPWRRARPRSC